MNVDELINKLQYTLTKIINKNGLYAKIIEPLNELLQTIKTIENCIGCKDKKINGNILVRIENYLAELEEEEERKKEKIKKRKLNYELNELNNRLNKEVLCEGCKGKKIEKLTDKCGNEEIARVLYDCELNAYYGDSNYIRWISFDEFENIEYLAKGGFGEVHKATWTKYYVEYKGKYKNLDVVLKRIYNNSSDGKIVDILKELKANSEFGYSVDECYGVTKNPNEDDYLLVFNYAKNGDLHNNLSKNFKEITWQDKIESLYNISQGLMEIHEKNYIHHDLHSGNILSHNWCSLIGDLGLCQKVVDKKDNPNKIFGVIPYLAPEVLSKKPYTKESDIYSFGMIMWEFTTGKKPFHDRPHNYILISDILKGERPQITDDTPEFYTELMKKCWDNDPENRPTAKEIQYCFREYCSSNKEKEEIIKSAEAKRQEIIKSDKFLLDTKNYKHHPKSFYTSRLLNESIEQAGLLLNLSSTEIQINNMHIKDDSIKIDM